MPYLLTNWPAYLYGRIQSSGPDVMGIMRAAGFEFARIDTFLKAVTGAINRGLYGFSSVNTAFVRTMSKKGTGNDKQEKDAGKRTLCRYRNFSQAIKCSITTDSTTT